MTTFWGQSDPSGNGKFSLGTEHNVLRFKDFLKKHPGIRLKIDPYTPESREQRGFFEGAVIPFITYFQENLDYTDSDHLKRVRDWLMIEFNASFLKVGGKSLKVPKSSKGELNRGLLERIMDWSGEQGYPIELLNPEDYKTWNDTTRQDGGPRMYIEYLESIGKLHRP
jgi:hypothetical protein